MKVVCVDTDFGKPAGSIACHRQDKLKKILK